VVARRELEIDFCSEKVFAMRSGKERRKRT